MRSGVEGSDSKGFREVYRYSGLGFLQGVSGSILWGFVRFEENSRALEGLHTGSKMELKWNDQLGCPALRMIPRSCRVWGYG